MNTDTPVQLPETQADADIVFSMNSIQEFGKAVEQQEDAIGRAS